MRAEDSADEEEEPLPRTWMPRAPTPRPVLMSRHRSPRPQRQRIPPLAAKLPSPPLQCTTTTCSKPARQIQLSILPASFPDSTSFRIAARYLPMTSVAGDFYDFLMADAQQVGILVADVAGHGVPAALIASMVKVAASGQSSHVARPSELLSGMNDSLCGNAKSIYHRSLCLFQCSDE
jgi:serine phosphatase RsbU (regulator of sigma subunit)